MHLKALILYPFLLSVIAASASGANDVSRNEDYRVYSAALANIRASHAGDNETLVIMRNTLNPRLSSLPSPTCSDLSMEVRRLVEDIFAANQNESSTASGILNRGDLSVGKPYALISQRQADEWLFMRSHPQIPTDPSFTNQPDPFPGSRYLIRVSNVLFSRDKSVALVYVSAICGTLCGSSEWKILRKVEGVWRVMATPLCSTIS